jgi:hypothetical protein
MLAVINGVAVGVVLYRRGGGRGGIEDIQQAVAVGDATDGLGC